MLQVRDCEDLEQLVLYSGILKRVSFNDDLKLVVKSLNDAEERFIFFQTGLSINDFKNINEDIFEYVDKFLKFKDFMACYVAYSVIYVNGFCCLEDRHSTYDKLKDYFYVISFDILKSLFFNLVNLKKREIKAVENLEVFCRTSFSKVLFSSLSHSSLNSLALTGIPGYSSIPLSYTQLLFINYMTYLKERETFKLNLYPFKFVASLFSSDAVKKLESSMLREELLELKRKREDFNNVYSGPSSVKDIVDQLHDMVSGKEDHMDSVIKREERKSFEAWKENYLARFRNVDPNIKALGNVELPDLSEEALLRRYTKEFRFSSWLLDEYLAEKEEL